MNHARRVLRRSVIALAILLALPLALLWTQPLFGQGGDPPALDLNDTCFASVLTQDVQLAPDGTIPLNNLPLGDGKNVVVIGFCDPPEASRVYFRSICFFLFQNGAIPEPLETSNNPFPGIQKLIASADPSSIPPGGQTQMSVLAEMSSGPDLDLTNDGCTCYSSTTPSVATVDENGLVTAAEDAEPGATTLVIVSNSGAVSSVEITIVEPVPDQLGLALIANWSTGAVHVVDVAKAKALDAAGNPLFTDAEILVTSLQVHASTAADVAISCDKTTAVAVSFSTAGNNVTFIDLTQSPPVIPQNGQIALPLLAEDVSIGCTLGGFAVICDGGTNVPIFMIDIATGAIVGTPVLLANGCQGIAVSPDGTQALAARTVFGTVRVLNVTAGGLVDTGVDVASAGSPGNVKYSPLGNIAFVMGRNGQVGVLNIGATVTVANVFNPGRGLAQSVAFKPDGSQAYVLHTNQVTLWDIDANGVVTQNATVIQLFETAPTYFGADQIMITPDGQCVIVHTRNRLYFIDGATNTITRTAVLPGDFQGGGGDAG